MANTKFYWPGDDDPIFSAAFVVYSPIRPATENPGVRRSPYVHSPEEGEGEQVWTIQIPIEPADD